MSEQDQIDQPTQELIIGGVDGELSQTEQAELEHLLSGSPDLRMTYDEMVEVVKCLDSVPELQPPEYLQGAIINSVRLPVPAPQKQTPPSFWSGMPWLRAGFAMVVGAVITVGIYELDSNSSYSEHTSSMVGTIAPGGQSSQGSLIDRIDIDTNNLSGALELRSIKDYYLLDIQVTSDSQTELSINLNSPGLVFASISLMQDQEELILTQQGLVKITSYGKQHHTLTLRNKAGHSQAQPQALRVDFYAKDALLYRAELSLSEN